LWFKYGFFFHFATFLLAFATFFTAAVYQTLYLCPHKFNIIEMKDANITLLLLSVGQMPKAMCQAQNS
jgi:hypothetical protein